ncbi:acyl-CoA dehydrogenase family protein [soil metagenome]
MSDPYLTDEHEAVRSMVREFAQAEIEPHAEEWDRTHEFPLETVQKMGELGLFGIPFPESVGGGGGDLTGLCVAIEEVARVDQSMAITLEAAVGLGANPIYRFGTEEQQQRWLPDLCAGTALGGFGLTEPDAGSDAGGTRTRADVDDSTGEWVINGEKAFITNSGTLITSHITVTALTGPGEISAIIVPSGTPGLDVQPPYRKMGWHASDTHGLTLVDCRVPADHMLGERGRGFAQFLEILDEGRVAIAALAVGVIQRCVDDSVAYAGERETFGRPIGSNQGVAFRCADIHVALQAARRLVYDAAWRRDHGHPFTAEAATAKLFASEAAVDATRSATQIFGGYGFMDETPVARHYRDAKILEIGEGTSEIQRLVISRALGLGVS